VDKFIGDAVMALFGAPVGSETSSQVGGALRMTLAMHQRTLALNAGWCEAGVQKQDLTCRMGTAGPHPAERPGVGAPGRPLRRVPKGAIPVKGFGEPVDVYEIDPETLLP
jgi:class 3 adenylate cyclase